MQVQDAFGLSTEWVGLDNFRQLWDDSNYLESFKTTAWFSVLVAALGIGISLVLAIFADRIVRGAMVYKTLLIMPYAVAPVDRRRAVGVHLLALLGVATYRPARTSASTGTT